MAIFTRTIAATLVTASFFAGMAANPAIAKTGAQPPIKQTLQATNKPLSDDVIWQIYQDIIPKAQQKKRADIMAELDDFQKGFAKIALQRQQTTTQIAEVMLASAALVNLKQDEPNDYGDLEIKMLLVALRSGVDLNKPLSEIKLGLDEQGTSRTWYSDDPLAGILMMGPKKIIDLTTHPKVMAQLNDYTLQNCIMRGSQHAADRNHTLDCLTPFLIRNPVIFNAAIDALIHHGDQAPFYDRRAGPSSGYNGDLDEKRALGLIDNAVKSGLLHKGFDFNAGPYFNILEQAVNNGRLGLAIRLLPFANGDINRTEYNSDLLFSSAVAGFEHCRESVQVERQLQMLDLLVAHGASPQARNRAGDNAFVNASFIKNPVIAQQVAAYLKTHKVNFLSVNKNGQTAVAYALSRDAYIGAKAFIDAGLATTADQQLYQQYKKANPDLFNPAAPFANPKPNLEMVSISYPRFTFN